MMSLFFALSIIAICYSLFHYLKQKQLLERVSSSAIDAISSHEDMKETLRIGLYNRFKRDLEQDKEEDPLMFEHFVANIMTTTRGGSTYVTKSSGDFGIDIEERADKGLYLGQVKCYKETVGYEPIAIIHSQMVKQGAVGGYVITTSDFTSNARAYAQGLNIDLINGRQLVDLWLAHLESKRERVPVLNPELQM
ncbi:restriction endonuclease [Paenibacillus sp. strain BS8-2]